MVSWKTILYLAPMVVSFCFIGYVMTKIEIWRWYAVLGLVLAFGLGIFLSDCFFFACYYRYWAEKNVFTLPPSNPHGNAKKVISGKLPIGMEMKHIYNAIKREKKRFGGYYFATLPVFVPIDLDLIKKITNDDFEHFTDHIAPKGLKPLEQHLYLLKGDRWKSLRDQLAPSFISTQQMLGTMLDCSEDLLNAVDDFIASGKPVDIQEVVGQFATDVSAACTFGLEYKCSANMELRENAKKCFEQLPSLLGKSVFEVLNVGSFSRDENFFLAFIGQIAKFREQAGIIRHDHMHYLLRKNPYENMTTVKNGKIYRKGELSTEEVAAQAFAFFISGMEIPSIITSFCLYELAVNIAVQVKLREEIKSAMGDGQEAVDLGALEIPYLNQCIEETLRKHPPFPVLTRQCTKTYRIIRELERPWDPLVLKKGTFVVIPILGIHHDPDYYTKPASFMPERFSEAQRGNLPSGAWLPFGNGPRSCPGVKYGMMMTKVALIVLLKNYKFTVAKKTKADVKPDRFLLTPSRILLNAEKIKQ